jgi:hypothetical protein
MLGVDAVIVVVSPSRAISACPSTIITLKAGAGVSSLAKEADTLKKDMAKTKIKTAVFAFPKLARGAII